MFLNGVIGIFSSKKIFFSVTTMLQTSTRTEEFEVFPMCLYFLQDEIVGIQEQRVIKTMGSPAINLDIRVSFIFPTISSLSVTCLTSYHCWRPSIPRLLGHLLQLLILSKRNVASHVKDRDQQQACSSLTLEGMSGSENTRHWGHPTKSWAQWCTFL